ncbi:hypothetical protein [Sodalis sp.]
MLQNRSSTHSLGASAQRIQRLGHHLPVDFVVDLEKSRRPKRSVNAATR